MTEPVIHEAMVEAAQEDLRRVHAIRVERQAAESMVRAALRSARDLGATHIDLRGGELVTLEKAWHNEMQGLHDGKAHGHHQAAEIQERGLPYICTPLFFVWPITPTEPSPLVPCPTCDLVQALIDSLESRISPITPTEQEAPE